MKVGLYGLVCALALGATQAKADWLDTAAEWSPLKRVVKEYFEPAYRGRHASAGELSQVPGADLAQHYMLREMRISTPAEWNTLLENYLALPHAQKHALFDYWEGMPQAYKVQNFLAKRHYQRNPKSFLALVRSYKHSKSSRPVGAAATNLILALSAEEQKEVLQSLRDTEVKTDAIAAGNSYTVQGENWSTYQKDQASYLWKLRVASGQGKMKLPYATLNLLSIDPRLEQSHYNVLKQYDANRDKLISHEEAFQAETRGNNGRNEGTAALMKFILADISMGNADRGVALFLTRNLHSMVEMLRMVEHRYYVTPLALLLDALIEENNTNPDCKNFCTGNQVVARTVAGWIIEAQHARYVAQMLPLMRNREGLLIELKKVAGIDFTSQNSPFTYLEEMAQGWGENLFGQSFQLKSNVPGNYADLLQRYVEGSVKE